MTTYMPSITIPQAVFLHPAASIALPIVLGTAVGYSTRREFQPLSSQEPSSDPRHVYIASNTQKTYLALKQPPLRPPPWVFAPVWTLLYGLVTSLSLRYHPQ